MSENEIDEDIDRIKTDDEFYNKIDSNIKKIKIYFIGDIVVGITNFVIISYSDMPLPIKVVSTSLLSLPLFKSAWDNHTTYKVIMNHKEELKKIDKQLDDLKDEIITASNDLSEESKLSDNNSDGYQKTYQK